MRHHAGSLIASKDTDISITIDLPPAQETRIRQEAQREGITEIELIQRALAERFAPCAEDDAKALALIEQWISEAPTDPLQQKEAEEDLLEFQRSINQTRQDAGARILYPVTQHTDLRRKKN